MARTWRGPPVASGMVNRQTVGRSALRAPATGAARPGLPPGPASDRRARRPAGGCAARWPPRSACSPCSGSSLSTQYLKTRRGHADRSRDPLGHGDDGAVLLAATGPLLAWRIGCRAAVLRRPSRYARRSLAVEPGADRRLPDRAAGAWRCARTTGVSAWVGVQPDAGLAFVPNRANAWGVTVLLAASCCRRRPDAPAAAQAQRAPGRAGRAQRAGAGPPRGAGGAHPDRPRAARRGRAPHVDDRGAGGDRAVPAHRS